MYFYETGRHHNENKDGGECTVKTGLEKTIAQRPPNKTSFHLSSPQIAGSSPRSENLLLASQPEAIFIKLTPFLERVFFNIDEYLYQPGDAIKYLYFPETAVFSDFQMLEDGRTIETALTGKEGAAGFMAFLSASPAADWTQTSIAGSALKIDAGVFRREFNNHGQLQTILFDYLSGCVRQVSQRLICNTYHSVEQRFCGWLKMIIQRCGEFKLPLTQEQIARSLGAHRPTVSGIAKNLQREKIIDYCRGRISILDLQKLNMLACNCHRQSEVQYAKAAGV